MPIKDKSTRDKLLNATVHIIAKSGTINLTTREIARKARVNIAAINYYFRSKENLVNEAEQFFLENMVKALPVFEKKGIDSREALLQFGLEFIRYRNENATLFTNIVKYAVSHNTMRQRVVDFVQDRINYLSSVIQEYQPELDKIAARNKAIIFYASIYFPLFLSQSDSIIPPIDFSDDDFIRKYCNTLIDIILLPK